MTARWVPYVLVFVLGLVFFSPWICHRGQVLYSDHSDILAEHLPAKRFLVRSWRETGELPLWCPYNYGGMPFVHDPQVAIFYPPHWLFLALPQGYYEQFEIPEDMVAMVLSWQILVHVLLAGWGMVAYTRSRGLGTGGALTAGIGYMFAGKWLLHLLAGGHYITIGLAWLPWLMLLLERAIQRRSFFPATAAGVIFAFMILGTQPQWTLYAGLLTTMWTLVCALEKAGFLNGVGERSRKRTLTNLGWWLQLGAWTVFLGVVLSAVQLLPTMEAARESTRGGGVNADMILAAAGYSLFNLFGPILNAHPSQANLAWEERGGLDVLWVAAAAMAVLLRGRRQKFEAGIALFLLLFAIGGSVAFQWLPGFSFFRQPSRMFMLLAFPVSFLAGATTDSALFARPRPRPELRRGCRMILLMTAAVAALLAGAFAWKLHQGGVQLDLHPYWIVLGCAVAVGLLLLFGSGSRWKQALWMIALLANVWTLAWPLVQVRPVSDIFPMSGAAKYVFEKKQSHGRVLDRDAPDWVVTGAGMVTLGPAPGTGPLAALTYLGAGISPPTTSCPLGPGAPMAILNGIEAIRGYTPLDVRRYKEFLQFIGDSDEPLRTLENHLTFPVIRDIPIKNKSLADLLGIEFVLQPRWVPFEQAGWEMERREFGGSNYDLIGGGVKKLPPYLAYRNRAVFPRAFVVFQAERLPPRPQVLEALKKTDFRNTVLLDPKPKAMSDHGSHGEATIETYEPNRVVVAVQTDGPGYLVLTDQWYPGWTCTVDGKAAPLYRADYLFRAVAVPGGQCRVEFRFWPDSYARGRIISLVGLGVVAAMGVLWLWSRLPLPKRKLRNTSEPGSL